jgi:hypothetical protein
VEEAALLLPMQRVMRARICRTIRSICSRLPTPASMLAAGSLAAYVRILLRAHSGFARGESMAWCEENRVDYVFGLARNTRLVPMIEDALAAANAGENRADSRHGASTTSSGARLDCWSRRRRVVARTKSEATPRFVVTSFKRSFSGAREPYEDIYCALYADRTSAAAMRSSARCGVSRLLKPALPTPLAAPSGSSC